MKKLTIILLLLTSACFAQQNRKEYSYTLNSSYKIGYNLEGTVLSKNTEKKWNERIHYIILVKGNTTSKIRIENKQCFLLLREMDYIVLPNCKLLTQTP